MSTIPVLHTPRLLLSRFEESDAPDVLAYASDPRMTVHLTWNPHPDIQESLRYIHWTHSRIKLEPGTEHYLWAMRDKDTKRVIGSFDFSRPNAYTGRIDYALAFGLWGRGLVSEAAITVRDFAFARFPEMARLMSFAIADNVGSRRVMEKAGMSFEGIARKAFLNKGKLVDLANYSILREEWDAIRADRAPSLNP